MIARHGRHSDPIGTVFSRSSGNRGFAGGQTIGHIHPPSRLMKMDLAAELPGLTFKMFSMADAKSGAEA